MELIKIENGTWNDKVNFIDENNVVLGYDMGQACCEHAGFYVTKEEPVDYRSGDDERTVEQINEELKGFLFDVEYFKEIVDTDKYGDENENVIFKAINGTSSIYIVLFNSHNGYYEHGFLFVDKDKNIKNGSI